MACDPQSLLTAAGCLTRLSSSQLLATWALQACEWPGPTPPSGDGRITEEGDDRDTEEGDDRIIE